MLSPTHKPSAKQLGAATLLFFMLGIGNIFLWGFVMSLVPSKHWLIHPTWITLLVVEVIFVILMIAFATAGMDKWSEEQREAERLNNNDEY